MVYIVLEDSRAPIFSNKIVKLFPDSAIKRIAKFSRTFNVKLLQQKPILTNQWLVLVDSNVPLQTVKSLLDLETVLILLYSTKFNSSKAYSYCKEFTDNVKIVDVLSPKKSEMISYIRNELDVSENIANLICNHCCNFLPYITEAINILKPLDILITSSVLNYYVPKPIPVNPTKLFYHLVGVKLVKSKDLVTYFYRFRYAFSYLQENLLMMVDTALDLYKNIASGCLGSDNLEDFYRNASLSVSLHFVSTIYSTLYSNKSFEELYILRFGVAKAKDILELYTLFL